MLFYYVKIINNICSYSFVCFFCSVYPSLKEHFREYHYLCEEGTCSSAEFTHAYRSDIDLRAHVAQNHTQSFRKSQIKQMRTLDIDINLAPREGGGRARSGAGVRGERRRDHHAPQHRGNRKEHLLLLSYQLKSF